MQIFAHYTSRFVPIAKEFLCVICSFSTANNLSIPTSEPNLFDGFLPLGSQSVCYVCRYHPSLFHSGVFELARQPYVLDCFALGSFFKMFFENLRAANSNINNTVIVFISFEYSAFKLFSGL